MKTKMLVQIKNGLYDTKIIHVNNEIKDEFREIYMQLINCLFNAIFCCLFDLSHRNNL